MFWFIAGVFLISPEIYRKMSKKALAFREEMNCERYISCDNTMF